MLMQKEGLKSQRLIFINKECHKHEKKDYVKMKRLKLQLLQRIQIFLRLNE